ncbi:3-ketoacyl-CoA synthase 7-like [Salvia splendens]|uniref:3-ketoacyl-CoA synthase 7-like n=1 Tax=Salvia splendens TaxID=180675 RepID=UPI001C26ACEB|nr:3-ketoacyl-CoA synthase 7-like [Salvia splendens]
MGCSAGILALHLARDVLNVHGNSLALILSMESVAVNFYKGDTKSMLLSNCLFRMGGAGALLSNRPPLQVAGEALKENMTAVGKVVLSYWEQVAYVWGGSVPELRKGMEHFCIHAGGKAVIEAIRERLRLRERDVEASKMALWRFGNKSSSSTWYALAYLEANGRLETGDKVCQLAFGSGFKCNTAIWKCVSPPRIQASNV